MKRTTNNLEVKKLNRNRVFRYVNSLRETSMPDISAALDISGPTVLTIVNELKNANVITEVGEFQSTGGRKAKAFATIKDVKYSIGVDITRNHVSLVYTDLTEKALKHKRIRKPFEYTNEYFKELTTIIGEFVAENQIPEEKIVGIGMSVPAIIDGERGFITNSHVLTVHNVPTEEWTRYMPYPCELINDANAAAITEHNDSGGEDSMVYLSLSNSVGGAVVFKNEIGIVNMMNGREGDSINMYIGNNWRSGEFGHMVIHPDGKQCYCGKKGCVDAYCSALNLAELEDGHLELFFEKLRGGNEEYQKIWQEYMTDLSIAIDNLRMCFDCDVVLGGYVGSFISPYIPEIRKMVAEKNIFDYNGSYVRACRYQVESSALGAAIFLIEKYIDAI